MVHKTKEDELFSLGLDANNYGATSASSIFGDLTADARK
jgi:hypothetical protein